jgi:fructokinase
VSIDLVSIGNEKTTMAVATLDASGRAGYEFVVEGTSAPQLTPAMLPPRLSADVEAIVFGSLGLVLEPMATTLFDLVDRERGGPVLVLDPNVRPGLIPDSEYRDRLHRALGLSDVVKASDADLAWVYEGATHQEAAERLLEQGVRLAVVTRGARGAFAAHRDLRVSVPAVPVDVVDTIGAGDAFGAALLAWLHDHDSLRAGLRLTEDDLRSALEVACRAAAITCSSAIR